MDQEFLAGLQQFQQQAQNLQNLMTDMQNRMPQGGEGTDAQGAVTVFLAADGIPESIKAASDWQRRQGPEVIGAAVLDAYGTAMSARMEGMARNLDEADWRAEADWLADFDATPGQATGTHPPTVPGPDLRYVVPRSLEEVAEEAFSAFDAVERLASAVHEPERITGRSTAHHVVLTVTKGALISCEVDPQWAAKQSSIGLNQALEEALADARGRLGALDSNGDVEAANQQLGGIFSELMALLSDPRRLAD
ncbi:hypothetical protein [Streptomyces sp. NPDC001665]